MRESGADPTSVYQLGSEYLNRIKLRRLIDRIDSSQLESEDMLPGPTMLNSSSFLQHTHYMEVHITYLRGTEYLVSRRDLLQMKY